MYEVNQKFREFVGWTRGVRYRLATRDKQAFECPICEYTGPFMDADDPSGLRPNAKCPSCSGVERHRMLWLTMGQLSSRYDFQSLGLLHFGPEKQLKGPFRELFGRYETADLFSPDVDHTVDLRDLPFGDGSYDVIVAAHVLEHIKEDEAAIENIHRVLKPGGFAILQVPLFGPNTVEYQTPNPHEWGHIRAPGEDYFERYRKIFPRVEEFRSSDFDRRFQPFVLEDRTCWPENFRARPTSPGLEHEDIVPVCFVRP